MDRGLIILVCACLGATLADVILVFAAKTPQYQTHLLVVGLAIMVVASYGWSASMRFGIDTTRAILIYSLCTVAACSLIGTLMFGERLSVQKWVGVGLGSLSLALLVL